MSNKYEIYKKKLRNYFELNVHSKPEEKHNF